MPPAAHPSASSHLKGSASLLAHGKLYDDWLSRSAHSSYAHAEKESVARLPANMMGGGAGVHDESVPTATNLPTNLIPSSSSESGSVAPEASGHSGGERHSGVLRQGTAMRVHHHAKGAPAAGLLLFELDRPVRLRDVRYVRFVFEKSHGGDQV